MANNVVPICSNIKSAMNSKFSNDILFVDDTSSVGIANRIMMCDKELSMCNKFTRLDGDFIKRLDEIIKFR